MIFGNTFANLLQVIAVEGKSGSVVEKDFQSPLFHKIIAREVDVLDVEIRTLTGRQRAIAYFEGLPTFQRGYGYFLGVPRQKGAGVGAVLRNLWRYLRPMISAAKPYAANIAADLGKEGLETGARVLNQVSKGGDFLRICSRRKCQEGSSSGSSPTRTILAINKRTPFSLITITDIELTASGRTYPQYPYNLDYKNNNYARAYHDAQEHRGLACTTESNGLSYSMFKTAFCLYVFQMTNSQEDSPGFELIKEGCAAVIEKSPIHFALCILYLFGTAEAAAVGFYLFLRERRIRRQNGQPLIDKILFETVATRRFFMGTFPSDCLPECTRFPCSLIVNLSWQTRLSLVRDLGQVAN
uniref:Uncharacterized protein n=1 Tax=Globodera rostochiensis TaxID=31243 RepID=A0A914I1F6_GLORO